MPFVNEFIPEPDVVKHDLEAIDRDFVVGGTNARDWTVDRDRDMYLRNVANGGGTEIEVRNQTKFSFYWHGELLTLRLDLVDGGGARGQPGWSHWRLMRINGGEGLPEYLKADKEQFIADFKEALLAYKDFGVHSRNTDYHIVFEVGDNLSSKI
ncbi:hypothetical protein [Xanthomonas nasturtii]|uniref:Uncharacterized protein n=1 Tax=Xanthomonas nasturtii TaxID=1843581 RepID=A0ABT0LWK4_9XANT|nr:hypothetical protein [Xanthomonas nasturtii]MCL1501435.1 hypothetical protein [Xanthomonas nasturtii]MCL1505339.1 hypothetical protein [Xanthomonas nasturtii]MCL1524844.1 hypothetical protein [Xanthomonas nasturtii]MCL1553163.1 hypothetical protein [Xanthomonas nasturtii]MCL1556589.1 hypothetical protein [Xanthomonas nasturtii]